MARHIRKGDLVMVIAGKARHNAPNNVGRVKEVLVDKNPNKTRVIIEGMNVRKVHVKPSQANPQGGTIEREMSIHISNVMPVVDGKPTRVRFRTNADGSKVRVAARTNQPFGPELRKAR